MLVFFALGNAKVVSFALGDAKVPNASSFVLQWNIGFTLFDYVFVFQTDENYFRIYEFKIDFLTFFF